MSSSRTIAPTTLYVRNIPDRIRYDDLKRLFQKYGRVLEFTMPIDYYNGMTKGYCFVEYDDSRDAEEAQYKIDKYKIFGKCIDVEFARGQRKTPGEMKIRDKERKNTRFPGSSNNNSAGSLRSVSRGRSERSSKSRSRSRSLRRSAQRSRSRDKSQQANQSSRPSRSRSYSRRGCFSTSSNSSKRKATRSRSRHSLTSKQSPKRHVQVAESGDMRVVRAGS